MKVWWQSGYNIWHFDRGISSLVMTGMSVFKTGRESDCAALRLFLVNLAANGYQLFLLRIRKAVIKRSVISHLSVFINLVYHRFGMCQSGGLNCLGAGCGHFPTTSAERCVFPV